MDAPQTARQALALAERGDDAGASDLFDRGLALFPDDARFANSAGNFHAKAGRNERALALFSQALAAMPSLDEAAINAAIVLQRLGRTREAVQLLAAREAHSTNSARYWTVRADAERASGDLVAANYGYDRAIALGQASAKAWAGKARVALECGNDDAVVIHEEALAQNPGNADLFHDYAQALFVAGRTDEALECSRALTEQLPGWVPGLVLHAELRWAATGQHDFADHFANAAAQGPGGQVTLAWANTLCGVDRHEDAADVLARARRSGDGDPALALAEAIARDEAGDTGGAAAIFDTFATLESLDWLTARARHAIRSGDPGGASAMLDRALASHSSDVTAWALRDLCWRLLGDDRHYWLHGREGLVRELALPLEPAEFTAIRECLLSLHARTAMPIGQSVKQGSQTKGALFARREPELARLKQAIEAVLEEYRAALPAPEGGHPLLSLRNAAWAITGSWSIRLDGQGRHAPHIHPRGLLSSACYFEVPDEVSAPGRPGWLELGRPPAGLADELGPIHTIEPRPGHCALFPSTLFHGTRPITKGRRMTVAFDVTTAGG